MILHLPDEYKKVYSFSDAQRLTGVARGHLARWAETGIIAADLGGGGVSGAHRRFSFRNIFEIAIAVELQKYRVDKFALRHVLQQLRMLDPETVATVDIPANRVRREYDALPAKERRQKLAAVTKKVAQMQKQGGGTQFRFNPYLAIENLHKDLASAEDNEAKRWNAFKSPATRGEQAAFISLSIGVAPIVSFHASLREIEETMAATAAVPHITSIWGNTAIVINAARILKTLELATNDHL